jgi:protein phosphatase
LICVHAALRPEHLALAWATPRSGSAANGETNGRSDRLGRPLRTFGWMPLWENSGTTICFGHNVCGELPVAYNEDASVIALDTGCAFGGSLCALRWPEREVVRIPAHRSYAEETPVAVPASLAGKPLSPKAACTRGQVAEGHRRPRSATRREVVG